MQNNFEIPLYSKNPEFTGLPLYYDEAKDCRIKINNTWFYDFSTMGVGCNILGYKDKYVNHFVKNCINKGNISSLNTRYMEKLTNLLLSIHKDYNYIRYAKCGGEALDIALKLAIDIFRDKIITIYQIGYNGWLIKNEDDTEYKSIQHKDKINDIINENIRPDIIIFELVRHEYPQQEVFKKLNDWQKQGTILIIDEVTTGFRFCCGGIYQLYDLKPDIIVYAKGISNGYPFACIIGKEEILKSNMWISSTYWTDSIGFVAAYYTIKKLKYCNYLLLNKLGESVYRIWTKIASLHNLRIKTGKVNNIANFEFDYACKNELKSIFIQEMYKNGIIATNQFYPSFSHNSTSIVKYLKAINKTFEIIKKYIECEINYDIIKLKELKV